MLGLWSYPTMEGIEIAYGKSFRAIAVSGLDTKYSSVLSSFLSNRSPAIEAVATDIVVLNLFFEGPFPDNLFLYSCWDRSLDVVNDVSQHMT